MRRKFREQGFTLIEILIAFMVIAVAIGAAVRYYAQANTDRVTNEFASALSAMAAQVQKVSRHVGSSSWAQSPRAIAENGFHTYPILYEPQTLYDPWNNTVLVYQMTTGPTKFLVALGYATGMRPGRKFTPEICVSLASKLAPEAEKVTVGNITSLSATGAGGGLVYKAADGSTNHANLVNGCSQVNSYVALEYR